MACEHLSKRGVCVRQIPVILIGCCIVLAAHRPTYARQVSTQPRAQITGRVFDNRTGVPIQGARMTLSDWALESANAPNYPSTETQADGAFVLAAVPPGEYRVSADKDGYVDRSRKITVSASYDININFSLNRFAAISGQVVDEASNGIAGVRVGAWSTGFRYGHPTLYSMGFATSDQTGHYRIGDLRKGVYFVGTEPEVLKPKVGSPPPQVVTRRELVYARSFYPDGGSLAQAAGISLDNEQDLTGVDVRMRKTTGYCVTASLPGSASREGKVVVVLQSVGSPTQSSLGTGSIGYAKQFYFCGVPSGDYVVFAIIASTALATNWVASEHLTVDKGNVNTGALALEQALQLKGQVVVEKGQLMNQPPIIGLQLEPVDRWRFGNEDVDARSETSGSITFNQLYSGDYWVDVMSISPGYYVSQISAGPRDGIRGPIQVGDGDLTVTVRSDGASVSGIVSGEGGSEQPAPVFVILAPSSTLSHALIQSTRIDQSGKFSFNNVPPGKFNIVAVLGSSPEDADNPAIVNHFASQAREIDLAPYSSNHVELQPVQAP